VLKLTNGVSFREMDEATSLIEDSTAKVGCFAFDFLRHEALYATLTVLL